MVNSGSRSRGFEPHSGSHVVSLRKTYLAPPHPSKKKKKKNSTDNTLEAVAPSQYDGKLFTGSLSINQTKTVDRLMYNLTDFLSYTGVNGVISYTNRFSEHNIDIGVISNDYLCRKYNM